jgi:hypothetical protein
MKKEGLLDEKGKPVIQRLGDGAPKSKTVSTKGAVSPELESPQHEEKIELELVRF